MTKKQLYDLKTIEYFIPQCMRDIEITDRDRELFMDYSEKGKNKDLIDLSRRKRNGVQALYEGKKWRGIHIHELWEKGILDGSVGYYVLLGGEKKETVIPREVVDFMKKEIFKGCDSELIERTYLEILEEKKPWYKKILDWIIRL